MPRVGLSAERVVDEAEILTDEGGPLTLVELARRLGVQVPSLYKHVDGAVEIQRRVSVRAKAELADVLARATVGKSHGAAVGALATAYRDWATRHPGRYATTLRAPNPDDAQDVEVSARAVQVVFDALGGFGLTGDDAIDATRFVRATLHGWVALAAAGGFALPDLDRSFASMVNVIRHALDEWASLTI